MNRKVEQAVARLNRILPLSARKAELSAAQDACYRSLLEGFFSHGRALSVAELEEEHAAAASLVAALAERDLLTLNEQGEVYGCYPFTMDPRVHRVLINGHEAHAMCALDALAPAAMFECAADVLSECAETQAPVHIRLHNEEIENRAEVEQVFFGINWQAASACCSCADSLCTEMIFLKDGAVAQQWRDVDAQQREIFTLDEAVAFSSAFFKPLMETR